VSGVKQAASEGTGILGTPTAAAAIAVLGLIAALLTATVSPTAGAIAVLLLTAIFVAVLVFVLRTRALYEGPYHVVWDKTVWTFNDTSGADVTVTRTMDVRFNYPCFTVTEKASGDGQRFADFTCNYGKKIYEFDFADESRAIILMDSEARRGQAKTLESTRRVRDAFLQPDEWVRLTIDKPGGSSELTVIFPKDRAPIDAKVKRRGEPEQPIAVSAVDDGSGRMRLTDRLKRPKAGDELLFTWSW
jgi:hypothetical protein